MFGVSGVGMGSAYLYQANLYRQTSPASTQAVGRVAPAETTPVPPVNPVAPVQRGTGQLTLEQGSSGIPFAREGADPVEMAVRGRIQYVGQEEQGAAGAQNGAGMTGAPSGPETAAAREGQSVQEGQASQAGQETKSPQEVMAEGECQTCKERKYQDVSDDPGVSYQTPTNIAPQQAAAAVRGHEQEHVVREQAKAQREDRQVVSQSVTLHTAICPECGRVYVSGGTTRTTTRASQAAQLFQQQEQQPSLFQAMA